MYRPVSITPIFGKRMEHIIKKYISDHLLKQSAISRHQHGFLAHRSVSTQLLECINDWSSALDAGKSVDVLYIDISKAFDSISHKLLKQKLKTYGIVGKFYDWISDFFAKSQTKSSRKRYRNLWMLSAVSHREACSDL